MTAEQHGDDVREIFWNACRDGKLRLQRCRDCALWQFYARYLCRHCGSRDLEWAVAAGTAHVQTFSIVNRAEGTFADLTPYVVAMVQLAEGPSMMTNIVGSDAQPLDLTQVRIGLPVRVRFVERDGHVLPLFTPDERRA